MLSLETLIPLAVFLAITLGRLGACSGMAAGRPSDGRGPAAPAARPGAAGAAEADLAQAAGAVPGQGHRGRQQAGPVAPPLRRAGAGQDPAQAAERRLPPGAGGGGLLRHQADRPARRRWPSAFPPAVFKFGMTQTTYVFTAVCRRRWRSTCPASSSGKLQEEARRVDLPRLARRARPDGRLRRGRASGSTRRCAGSPPSWPQSCPVLCEEFAIANFQLQMGRPRKDVLRDLGIRTGVDDVRSLAAVIIQAEKFGSSIGSALRVQSDAMRLRRRQLAEERAAKTAVKIMIPLILFIFPGVFVVLVGPAVMQMAILMANP